MTTRFLLLAMLALAVQTSFALEKKTAITVPYDLETKNALSIVPYDLETLLEDSGLTETGDVSVFEIRNAECPVKNQDELPTLVGVLTPEAQPIGGRFTKSIFCMCRNTDNYNYATTYKLMLNRRFKNTTYKPILNRRLK